MHEPHWLNDIRLKLEIFVISVACVLAGMLYLAYGTGPLEEQSLPLTAASIWDVALIVGGVAACAGMIFERLRTELFGYVVISASLTFLALAVLTHINSSSDIGLIAFLFGLALAVVNRVVITAKAITVLEGR